MFTLISGFWEYLWRKHEIHVLILGLDAAGKTTLLERLKKTYSRAEGTQLDKIAPTVGLNLGRIDMLGCKLICWDLGGQSALRSIWEKYYSEAHAVVYVIDSCEPERFEAARLALQGVLEHESLKDAPVLVLANKQDKEGALSAESLTDNMRLESVCKGRVHKVAAVSAYKGNHVEAALHWLVKLVKENPRELAVNRNVD